jgi:hypothetical protein
LRRTGFFGAGNFLGNEAALRVFFPFDLDGDGGFDRAVFVTDEFFTVVR